MGVGARLYMYVVVVQKFTFAISSPDEFLFTVSLHCVSYCPVIQHIQDSFVAVSYIVHDWKTVEVSVIVKLASQWVQWRITQRIFIWK